MTDDQALAYLDSKGSGSGARAAAAGDGSPEAEVPAAAATSLEGLTSLVKAISGKAAAKAQAEAALEEAPAVEAPPAQAEPAQAATAEAGAEDGVEFETALRALRRAKTPNSVIRTLSRSDLIAWGREAAEVQARVDQSYTELQELKAKASTPTPQTQATPSRPTAEVEGAPVVDLKAARTKLADVLGLDGKDGQVLEEALGAVVAPLQRELAERTERLDALYQAVETMAVRDTRRRLEGQFPELADEAVFGKVIEQAKAMKGPGYTSIDDLLEDAFRVVHSRTSPASAQASKVAQAKAQGRPAPPSQRPAQKPLTPDERDSRVLQLLDAGVAPGDIEAQAGTW
jgi:hypothetical protein